MAERPRTAARPRADRPGGGALRADRDPEPPDVRRPSPSLPYPYP